MSAFIEERRSDFGVEPICRALEVSASAYYERRRAPLGPPDRGRAPARRDPRSPRRQLRGLWLKAGLEGAAPAGHRVRPLHGRAPDGGERHPGRQAPGQALAHHDARSRGKRKPDLVERDFTAEAPNRLWVADFTHLRTWEGVVFFSFVIDVFSRKVVGWQLATNMRTDLVLDALRMALGLRSPGADVALVHHSDRGSQYTSVEFTQALDDAEVLGSLGSTGDAYDNALAESFVDSFKTELIAERTWRSVAQAELAIIEWVSWFNHDRLHSSIGDIPPVEFEQDYAERVGVDPPPGSTRPTGSLRRAAGEQPQPLPSSVKLQDTEAT